MFIIPLFLGTAKIRLFVLFASGLCGYFVDFLWWVVVVWVEGWKVGMLGVVRNIGRGCLFLSVGRCEPIAIGSLPTGTV